jgi:hypothetical protein
VQIFQEGPFMLPAAPGGWDALFLSSDGARVIHGASIPVFDNA